MQELSDYQRRLLLKSPNVEKITEKHVVYKSKFKIKAVEKYLNGWKPTEIFEDAGIDPGYFINGYCRSCVKRWKKKYFEEGKEALKISQTGKNATGRPKSINTEEMTIDELKAMVEIQHEVIDMLKKNRALAKKKKEK
jgi:hypothetical protein